MQSTRSVLFVPSNVDRFVAKAEEAGADVVCLDLEDSVPLDRKKDGRARAARAIDRLKSNALQLLVRLLLLDDLGEVETFAFRLRPFSPAHRVAPITVPARSWSRTYPRAWGASILGLTIVASGESVKHNAAGYGPPRGERRRPYDGWLRLHLHRR